MLDAMPAGVLAPMRGESADVSEGPREKRGSAKTAGSVFDVWDARPLPGRREVVVESTRRLRVGDALRIRTSGGHGLAAVVVDLLHDQRVRDGEWRATVLPRLVNAEAMRLLIDSHSCTTKSVRENLRTLLLRLPEVDTQQARLANDGNRMQDDRVKTSEAKATNIEVGTRVVTVKPVDAWEYGPAARWGVVGIVSYVHDGGGAMRVEHSDAPSVVYGSDAVRRIPTRDELVPLIGKRVRLQLVRTIGNRGELLVHECTLKSLTSDAAELSPACEGASYAGFGDTARGLWFGLAGIEELRQDEGWIEVTTLEQAQALDGKMVEIDSARVDPAWDVPRLHGQIKQCHWDGAALRAGACGPTLWWVGRNVDGLRLRVVEESSTVDDNALPEIGRNVEIDVPLAEDRSEPAPGYTVRQHPSLGWIYEGKRDGRSNGGRSCEETIAETWKWHDFDAKDAEWKRAEAAGLTRVVATKTVEPRKCPTCMGARVLKHIVPGMVDEPCPDCPPKPKQGPSEWEVGDVRLDAGEVGGSTAHVVTFVRGAVEATFRVVAWNEPWMAKRTTAAAADPDGEVEGPIKYVVRIDGECCPEMAIARLLCGLRDGTVKP